MSRLIPDSEHMRYFPDFFIIGAPKCGTTALHEWLSAHPQVHAPYKEPSFFSQDIAPTKNLPEHIPSLRDYCLLFSDTPAETKIIGEATPKYLYSDRAIQHIRALRPDAKIILCLRDPIDLAISFHNQKIKEGIEKESDFVAAWRRSIGSDGFAPRTLSHTIDGEINYVFWASVGRRIEKLYDYFSAKQVHVIFLHDMKVDPAKTYASLLDFLGLDHDGRTDFPVVNERVRVRWLWLHRLALTLRRRAFPVLQPFIEKRGGRGTGLLKALWILNTTRGHYISNVTPEFRLEMHRTLHNDIMLAEQLIGKKVSMIKR